MVDQIAWILDYKLDGTLDLDLFLFLILDFPILLFVM